MNIEKFLERIAFKQPIKHDFATLRALHQQYILTVPFENLDIHYGYQRIEIGVAASYKKIVEQKRGGFCFESNSLFAWALKELGFSVELLAGQMTWPFFNNVEDDKHMLLKINVEGKDYAADVGNGQSFRIPLAIDGSNQDCTPEGICYRMGECIYDNNYQALYYRNQQEQEWQIRFIYSTTPRSLNDFKEACHYQQTSPLSNFVKGPIITLALPDGRLTLSPNRVKRNHLGNIQIDKQNEATFLKYVTKELGYKIETKRVNPIHSMNAGDPIID